MAAKPDNSTNNQLLPTQLTSIEKFHFFGDCYEFPNNLFCRIRFSGKVDREKAIEAVKFFEKRHPLINAVIVKKGSQFFWEDHDPPSKTLRWSGDLDPPSFPGLDVTEKPGVQLLFQATDEKFEVWVQAHHATLDGGAGIQIANEWMVAYDNLVAGRPVDQGLSRLDASQLSVRNKLGLTSSSYLKQLSKQPIALFGATKFLFRRFGLLTNAIFERSDPVVLHDTFPVIHGDWIEPETVTSLRNQSIKHRASLNSVLLTHLYLTVREWRTEHQHGRPEDWIRVVMPMSIRGMADRRMSAANRSSIVQLDRRPQDFDRPDKMAQGLDYEIGLIRQWQLNKMFLILVRSMSVFTPWLRSSAENKKYRGTIVFTNLGTPFSKNRTLQTEEGMRAGNLKLDYFDWVGPVRPGLGVNFSVQLHDDRIRISMHVDTRQVGFDDARELFEAYLERLNTIRI